MIFIGYEIREKYANNPSKPMKNYSLDIGNITMDSCLCRQLESSSYRINNYNIYLYDDYNQIKQCFFSLNEKYSIINDFNIFGYYIEEDALNDLKNLERKYFNDKFTYFRKETICQQNIPINFKLIGYDVLESCDWYDRWESLVANEGLPKEELLRSGKLNNYCLFEDFNSAIKYKKLLIDYTNDDSMPDPFIVKIIAEI